MESRLYPTWDQLESQHSSLTIGEKTLLQFLDLHLPKDNNWQKGQKLENYEGWLIFAQPYLNGSRPDIVIFNPQVGVVIYEVKDWNLYNYEMNGTALYVNDGNGSYRIKSPYDQVIHYKDKLIGQLIPNIGEDIDENSKKYGIIRTGVYFHKATTEQCRKLFKNKNIDYNYTPFFGNDYISKYHIKEIVPDINYKRSKYWNHKWNIEILFWLIPPFHSIEQGKILTLKGNQIKVAEPKSGHYRIRGVAGSGKTQALAYRAGKLAYQQFNVLIISFNITLWHYVKDMIARSPFPFSWSKITFNHFHGFCNDKLNEFNRIWPLSPQKEEYQDSKEYEKAIDLFFRVTVPNAVVEAIEGHNYEKYDAILIDEGQDYHYEWYQLLNKYFLTSRDELLIVCDKRQNIFNRDLDWLDKRITREGLEKFCEPYIDLTITYRLNENVVNMVNDFSEVYKLNQELKVLKPKDDPKLFQTEHIVWLNINELDWLDNIYNAFLRLKHEEYSPSDIVFLLPNHKVGKVAVDFFKLKNIEVNHVFEENYGTTNHTHKKAFWMGDGRLKMSTIHSFKGWELRNIVIFIPSNYSGNYKELDSIIYTAITRTRENLIVLNSNQRYSSFGDKLPKKWHLQT